MAQNVTVQGASYSDVPAVTLPKTGGGTATFTDVTDTTAAASDVASGKYFYTAAGVKTQGTNSGSDNDIVVTLTKSGGNFTVDKTYSELRTAFNAGKTVGVIPDYTYYYDGAVWDSEDYITFVVHESSSSVIVENEYEYYPNGSIISAGTPISYYDPSMMTATASDVANGKTFVNASGFQTGTASSGSSWTKIGSTTELVVNTTSTSAASAGTIALGSGHFTKDKIIYVRIRDKSGKRSGYFYGSDSFFINWRNANSSTSTLSVCAQEYYRCNSDGTYTGTSGAYGVYGYSLTTDGTLTIRRRYNSTNTLTINSTYTIDVYELTPPQALF